jgi:CDP-glycerol glycerophosphotransferase
MRERLPLNEKTIYLESRKCTDFASNIFFVAKELCGKEYASYKIYLGCTPQSLPEIKAKTTEYGLKNIRFVKRDSAEFYRVMATAKYLFTDFHLSHRYVKREGQVIVSLWHGTPLKTLGKDCRTETQASVQRIFLIADFQVYPGEFMKEKMIDAYWLKNLYSGKILCTGYPRNTAFFDGGRRDAIRGENGLDGKKAIMYMPTFRGAAGDIKSAQQNARLLRYFEELDAKLSDDEVLYLKLHNYNTQRIDCSRFRHIFYAPDNYDAYEFLNACDELVTDYSSVLFDFAVSRRKIILFQYDRDEYLKERGVCIPMETLPFPSVCDVDGLLAEIRSPKNYDDTDFLKKYATYDNKNATKTLVKRVIENQKIFPKLEETLRFDGKPCETIYCGKLEDSEEAEAFKKMLSSLETSKVNYYVSYYEPYFWNRASELDFGRNDIGLLGMWGLPAFTPKEYLCYLLGEKTGLRTKGIVKVLNGFYRREFIKHFGFGLPLDAATVWDSRDRAVVGIFGSTLDDLTAVKRVGYRPLNGDYALVNENGISAYLNGKYSPDNKITDLD